MKLRIRKGGFIDNNNLLVWVPYLLFLIVFNLFAAWKLLWWMGIGGLPPLYLDLRLFTEPFAPKWIAFPAGALALIEHLLIASRIETVDDGH